MRELSNHTYCFHLNQLEAIIMKSLETIENKNISFAIMLYQLASFIRSPRFIRFLNSNDSRFAFQSNAVHNKLRHDFWYQAKQAASLYFTRPYIKLGIRPIDIPKKTMAQHLSGKLQSMADDLFSDLPIKKTDKQFRLPRGGDLVKHLQTVFNSTLERPRYQFAIHDRLIHDKYFYEENLFNHFLLYIEARHTLAFETAHEHYEAMLSDIANKPDDFFMNGYPLDIYAHDALALRRDKKNNITAIQCNKAYASTVLISDSLSPDAALNGNNPENYRAYKMNSTDRFIVA